MLSPSISAVAELLVGSGDRELGQRFASRETNPPPTWSNCTRILSPSTAIDL